MYATIEQVEKLMAQFIIGPSTKPNSVQVEAVIDETAQEVNTALSGRGLVVPVTEPDYFLSYVGTLVSYGATAAVLKSMFPSASGPGETPAYAFWEARYRRGLEGIAKGLLVPSSAIVAGRTVRASTYFTRNPGGEESLGIHEPWFGRNVNF